MSKPINSLIAAALRHAASIKQTLAEQERIEREQRVREQDFLMRMGAVSSAISTGVKEGRRILPVLPTPHPSDEGRRPLRTNFPRPNQRIMPHGTHMAVMR